MTFSLVARCEQTGMFGLAIFSSSPAVAARCSFAQAGVGAVATQNVTDPSLGPLGLTLMQQGLSAEQTIERIRRDAKYLDYRQVLVVDGNGQTAIHSGANSLGIWTDAQASNVASGGNLLANDQIPQKVVDAFVNSEGHLGDRLIIAMQAGLAAGGEAGPLHSAGMKIVDKVDWPIADLRCDWTEACPIENIATAWEIYKPQLDAYLQRAANPSKAPSYGVPGDQ